MIFSKPYLKHITTSISWRTIFENASDLFKRHASLSLVPTHILQQSSLTLAKTLSPNPAKGLKQRLQQRPTRTNPSPILSLHCKRPFFGAVSRRSSRKAKTSSKSTKNSSSLSKSCRRSKMSLKRKMLLELWGV